MRRIFYLIIFILILSSLGSCSYSESIDTKLFVSGIGVDINEDGDYYLCFSYPDISEFSPESSKIKGAGSISGFGRTFYGAVRDIVSKSSKTLDLEHVKIIVASSKISKDERSFERFLDYLSHNPQISRRVYVCIGDGDAEDFIGFKPKSGEDAQVFISELVEHNSYENGITSITLNDILDSFSQDKNILVPILKLNEDKTSMYMSGSYIMDKYKFIKELDMKDSMRINFLRGDNVKIIDDVKFRDSNIDYEVENINRKIYDTTPRNINIYFGLRTIVKNCIDNDHDYVYEDFMGDVKSQLNNDINVKCTDLVNLLYREGIDILNFNNYFYKFKQGSFKEYRVYNNKWIKDVLINIIIDNNVVNTGNILF